MEQASFKFKDYKIVEFGFDVISSKYLISFTGFG